MADDKKHLESEDYGPECLKVLEGLEPARKRPEGFITDDGEGYGRPKSRPRLSRAEWKRRDRATKALFAMELAIEDTGLSYGDFCAKHGFDFEEIERFRDLRDTDPDRLETVLSAVREAIGKRTTLDALPADERRQAEQFLDDVREGNSRPRGPAETAAIEAARQFDRPAIPTPKGSRPTRSADSPPTGQKPKR